MNGTFRPRIAARLSNNLVNSTAAFFERPGGVLAIVFASALVTGASSYIVISTAIEASRFSSERNAAVLPPQAEDTRSYPTPDTLDMAMPGIADPVPGNRTAPELNQLSAVADAPDTVPTDAVPVRVVEGRPPVMPLPRPSGELEVVAIARNMTPARALTLPRPEIRPETSAADPALAAASTLVAASSPRPALRPNDVVVRAAARAEELAIEVARAETPAALGGVGESPRGNIFSGSGNGDCSPRLAGEIPRRPGSAASGSAVMASLGNGSGSSRDNRLVQEALSGNVPSYIRDLQPVTLNGTVGGRNVEVTICVTPDYLAIGSDNDNVRVPLGLPAALRVADAFDMMLPTTTMVDAIYRQADIRVAPSPMDPTSAMSSTSYFVRHDETLDAQFARAGARNGMLVAGHKKDLVIANRLSRNPGRVAIYGWHRTNGNAIQPLSTVHGEYYADYSHGIRLVSRTAYINGRAVDLRDLLTDERYAGFLNSDGTLTGATIRLASL